MIAVNHFSRRQWQLWGINVNSQLLTKRIVKSRSHSSCNLAQNSNVPRSQADQIAQVSEEIVARVTKKLSQEFNRTESRILGSLSRLDEFLQNTLIQGHSGTTPETSRITLGANQGTNEDDSQCDLHPEVTISQSQNTRSTDPDDECDNCSNCKITHSNMLLDS